MIYLTEAAVGEIRRLQSQRRNSAPRLRLGVESAGCLGLSYKIDFDEVSKSGDLAYECRGIVVVVEAADLDYIVGMTLDYSEDLMGGAFRFDNPNAVQSCGCGNSFCLQMNQS